MARPLFSICIPAYNRARFLPPLLDSILTQSCQDFEIVICEDQSPERLQIAEIATRYAAEYDGKIRYIENSTNLGYDGNIRELVTQARGNYCFFMGNDDLMCNGALSVVAKAIDRFPDLGLILKSYAWFDENPKSISQTVRYFNDETLLSAGVEAISLCFRRSGVISGYIVHRDAAHECRTSRFDGTLYYQMHLTASVLISRPALCLPEVLVLCRASEPPEFGNSATEKGKFTPGKYTIEARVRMVRGALEIARHAAKQTDKDLYTAVERDYANYFYPYLKDQLQLPIIQYLRLYLRYAELGFWRHPMFHVYVLTAYLLGERRFDFATKLVRQKLGRSPHLGISKKVT